MENIVLHINGKDVSVDIEKNYTLAYVLREILDLTGAKLGCGTGDCGACKVIIDGEAVNSCVVQARNAVGKKIETIEGLSTANGLHPLQQAFVDNGAIQCGYCTPGMIMSAKALLDKNSDPSEEDILGALENNLCRCTGYVKIVEAIQNAARAMRNGEGGRS